MKSSASIICAVVGHLVAVPYASVRANPQIVNTKPLHVFSTERDDVTLLVFSPDGKTLASGGENCRLQFWDLRTGKKKPGLSRQLDSIYHVRYSPDGKMLATGTSLLVGVQLWNARTGQLIRTLKEPYPASKGQHVSDFEFAPDGRTLFVCAYLKGIQQWDISTGKLRHAFKRAGKQYGTVVSPDGRRLVSITALHRKSDKTIDKTEGQVWDVRSGKLVRSLPNIGWPIMFSRDGRQLYTSVAGLPNDNKWQQWSLTTGKLLYRAPVSLTANGGAMPLAISPDGRLLATGHKDRTVRIASARNHKPLQTLRAGNAMILGIAFSPDGSLMATSDWNSHVRLWRVNK